MKNPIQVSESKIEELSLKEQGPGPGGPWLTAGATVPPPSPVHLQREAAAHSAGLSPPSPQGPRRPEHPRARQDGEKSPHGALHSYLEVRLKHRSLWGRKFILMSA